jgi:hypothetical protein
MSEWCQNKNVHKRKIKIKFVVAKVQSIINLIKLVATMSIGVVWVVVMYGGKTIKILV